MKKSLFSLNKKTVVLLTEEEEKIYYEIRIDGDVKLEKSPLGVSIGKKQTVYEDYSVKN